MPSDHPHTNRIYFETNQGIRIPSVSAEEMRAVDQLAEETYSLGVLQMMENAGRTLALHAMQLCQNASRILLLTGSGGNGGGGLACMRHLINHGYHVDLLMTKSPDALSRAAKRQYAVLKASGYDAQPTDALDSLLSNASLVIDAIFGYSLKGAPRGLAKTFIQSLDPSRLPILSLDIPSGVDATTGAAPGVSILPTRTLTLALPKHGLKKVAGTLFLADIGIPNRVYEQIGLDLGPIFGSEHWLELTSPGG
ncbi:MAG: NAD(P)H-hydrate epimerase [Anaerolineales bacterium]|jgi:NAD(P)H-hydrate epimerase